MKLETILKGVAATSVAAIMASAATADVLKFAHVYETSHPLHAAAEMAAEAFAERTEGRHTIEVFPASSLGKEADLNEGLNLGTVDIIYTGAGFAGTIYGPASMTDFPFTLRNLKHWEAYFASDTFAEVAQGYFLSKPVPPETLTKWVMRYTPTVYKERRESDRAFA